MRERAGRTWAGKRLNRHFVAFEGDEVVGGVELFEAGRLQITVVEDAPARLRAFNRIVRVLPRDGELRQSGVNRLWFARDRVDVGRVLWRHARGAATETSNAVTTWYGPRGALGAVVPTRAWTPKTQISIAVRSPRQLSEDRVLAAP